MATDGDSREHTYTPEEANARLEDLRPRLERIREARRVVIESGERVRELVASDGGGHEGSEYFRAIRVLRAEIEHLATEDILLRDPETGLVDFPGELEGRRVFLCWRLDEDRVGHYHFPDAGLAGRRPL